MCVSITDCIKAGHHELLGVHAEPAKSHLAGFAIEALGFTVDLERRPLQAGRVLKMVEISEKVLDFEPHHRLAVGSRAVLGGNFLLARWGVADECRDTWQTAPGVPLERRQASERTDGMHAAGPPSLA
jgi:hypothetical protein